MKIGKCNFDNSSAAVDVCMMSRNSFNTIKNARTIYSVKLDERWEQLNQTRFQINERVCRLRYLALPLEQQKKRGETPKAPEKSLSMWKVDKFEPLWHDCVDPRPAASPQHLGDALRPPSARLEPSQRPTPCGVLPSPIALRRTPPLLFWREQYQARFLKNRHFYFDPFQPGLSYPKHLSYRPKTWQDAQALLFHQLK